MKIKSKDEFGQDSHIRIESVIMTTGDFGPVFYTNIEKQAKLIQGLLTNLSDSKSGNHYFYIGDAVDTSKVMFRVNQEKVICHLNYSDYKFSIISKMGNRFCQSGHLNNVLSLV
ncbi:hypothetical protein ACVR0P_06680 [Streptococcus castoreus]|uniref:hypothetical protein n=1 Tax=Streptococcus castoreus TaxID=254786 RepID=UPI0003FDB392|nr:hypothetical protein [Streptococcus castoreus]